MHTFGRQALGIVWDFMETNPFNEAGANWDAGIEAFTKYIDLSKAVQRSGTVAMCSATEHPLPDNSCHLFATDPPYYDAVPYADLSDFFYVWLRRTLADVQPELLESPLTRKHGEIVQLAERNEKYRYKSREYFEDLMEKAMAEGRRVLHPAGVGMVVFAHKATAGWETQLQAMVNAGWTITASWPIDTERPGRLRAQDSAALASSVHLVCRAREIADGSLRDHVGEWREVLAELPQRMRAWMPRLAKEGVVGADAIFACLGPALEIFSRYSRVEKASGDIVLLGEYLEHVWAAVAQEALSILFKDADASALEPDARLTAMWLWTLGAGQSTNGTAKTRSPSESEGDDADDSDEEDEDAKTAKGSKAISGYVLEFDAARKIAQGLGAHLDKLPSVVEVQGDKARLLSVAERTRYLFGKDSDAGESQRRGKKKSPQLSLFEEIETAEGASEGRGWALGGMPLGKTALDRVHQSMILFAAGRGEALKRFLVEDGAGKDARFWTLADHLSKLYPTKSDEKRWVDGVLGRKKGLGL